MSRQWKIYGLVSELVHDTVEVDDGEEGAWLSNAIATHPELHYHYGVGIDFLFELAS